MDEVRVMGIPFVSALPPRSPVPDNNFAGMLASWMDSSPGLGLSSLYCQEDMELIGELRKDIGRSIGEHRGDDNVVREAGSSNDTIVVKLHKYYNYLLECEEHGMTRQQLGQDGDSSSNFIALEWKSTVIVEGPCRVQLSDSLELERANVIWNLAAFKAAQASKQNLSTKPGWNKSSKFLQSAASWLEHLLEVIEKQQQYQHQQYSDMTPTFIRLWQALLLAQAQHCLYQSLTCMKRSTHLAAAKLAAAAVPLYKEVETIAQKDEQSPNPALSQCSDMVQTWAYFAKAWGVYMSCEAEYHQSQIDRGKKLFGQELARLDVAYQHAAVCKTLCDDQSSTNWSSPTLNELRKTVDDTLQTMTDQIESSERENSETHNQSIPRRQDLTDIRGEKLVKIGEPLSSLLSAKETEPIFQAKRTNAKSSGLVAPPLRKKDDDNAKKKSFTAATTNLLSSSSSSSFLDQKKKAAPTCVAAPNLQTYVEVFKSEMNEIISQTAKDTEEHTEAARLALAEVNLPHSLTAYQRELVGGGLPNDLWQRVHIIQKENQIVQLKQDLWELKDASDLARSTYQKILSQLDFDIESDRAFRATNPDFEGHDAEEVQRSFRQPLKNYDTLLSSAEEGDVVLFRRLEQLDVEPKYNLLQFSKSQLDRLLPGARDVTNPNMVFDTQHLTDLLAELSALFQEREDLLNMIRNEFRNYDIVGALQARVDPKTATDRDYLESAKYAQQAFDELRYEIQNNMKRQTDLLSTILFENEFFMNARERTTNSQSADSCIVMIEDAIQEIDQLSKHLKEGKDFYNVVIPKLDELNRQVGDVSARLTVERLEYDDKAKRVSQELKDALMAKNLFSGGETSHGAGATVTSSSAARRSPPDNGVRNVSSQPNVQSQAALASPVQNTNTVDDEKVATLVAMEFDPDKVVAALEKHNNNVDEALNELLSC